MMEPGREDEEEKLSYEDYRLGGRLYMVAGLVAAVLSFVMAPPGPWRWVLSSVAVVCLVRAGLYMYRGGKS